MASVGAVCMEISLIDWDLMISPSCCSKTGSMLFDCLSVSQSEGSENGSEWADSVESGLHLLSRLFKK